MVGVYNKWTHVQLAFQKERPYYLKLFPNTNMRQNIKHNQMWKGGELQVQKVGMVGETMEQVVGMELMWRHGMGTRTIYFSLIFFFS